MARQPTSRCKGDPTLSLAVHRHLAGDDQTAAFAAHGFTVADINRAIALATTPVADQQAAELRTGEVLIALRAPGVSIEHELRERLTDEAPDERLARLEAAGWFDATIHLATRDLLKPADAEAYAVGRAAFEALLADQREVA